MVLGSEGRYEQTLRTDQDNALIYRDPPPEKAEIARNYFQALGTEVCDTLNDVGYTWCQGGIMAKNPEWNKPVSRLERNVFTLVECAGSGRSSDGQDFLRFQDRFREG